MTSGKVTRLNALCKRAITNNLRVIQHAWHFWFGLSLVFMAVCGSIGIACLTP
ncbi:DUF3265 domain-containing protein [Vibrio parahaemolyticus]|nr:DUF3265 domain-containing protein [Vibrio parahaemolyticus]